MRIGGTPPARPRFRARVVPLPPRFASRVSLAPRTTFGVGGPARELCDADTEATLVEALASAEELVLLGGGSNVVVSDVGVDARVVAIATRGVALGRQGDRVLVTAAAGERWDALVVRTVDEGLAGLECLSGIPGLVGATPIQNVGAYGQEVADTIASLRAFDRETRAIATLAPEECAFRYRDSVFKSRFPGRFVVLSVTFALAERAPIVPKYRELEDAIARLGAPPTLRDVRSTVVALRRAKGMVTDAADADSRSAGSFFTNPLLDEGGLKALRDAVGAAVTIPTFAAERGLTKVAAAWLIERAGFRKGHRHRRAAISSKHALAITNTGEATAEEIVGLAREIRDRVRAELGVTLHAEPVFLGFPTHPLDG